MFPELGAEGDCSNHEDGSSSVEHDECPDNPDCPPGLCNDINVSSKHMNIIQLVAVLYN